MNNLLTKHKQYVWLAPYQAATVLSLSLFVTIAYFMEWYLKDKDFRINSL